MFQKGINNIEKMPSELRIRARTTWQLVVQVVHRDLGEEPGCPIQDDINTPCQLLGWEVTDNAQINADEPGNLLERLAVYPGFAACNDGQLARPERQQLFKRAFIC